ncbi:MAG: electron transport complex subunit RsxE, partial [Clostridiales bacterium]|nr:electron transport complex subunit RsxE [Clostridiales bacterium]
MSKNSKLSILTNGILKENPSLRLVLGTCPTLAVTTMAANGIGMGLAATFVLLCSNVAISALRKIIPDQVRIPCYITLIAGFVSVVQMIVKAYVPDLDKALGVYLPLIVVNCIILGRAEMFANKNTVIDSALDGIG